MSRRIERVNALIREEIAELLTREIQDPRLQSMVSITDVNTSPDLHSATILVSVLGTEEEAGQALSALQHAAGYLRKELGARLKLRHIPELGFVRDTSIQRGARLLELLHELETKREDG